MANGSAFTGIHNSSLPARLRIADALRNSRAVWQLSAVASLAKSFIASAPEDKLLLRATAYRRASPGFVRERLESQLSPWLEPPRADVWREKKIGWKRF